MLSLRVHHGYVDGDRERRRRRRRAGARHAARPERSRRPARSRCRAPPRRLGIGDAVMLAGFGLKAYGGTIDGTLNGDERHARRPGRVPQAAGRRQSNAVLLCAFSGSSSPCSGDSGAALVVADPTPDGRRRHPGGGVHLQLERVVRQCDRARDPAVHPGQRRSADGAAPGRRDDARGGRRPCCRSVRPCAASPAGGPGSPTLTYAFREGATGSVVAQRLADLPAPVPGRRPPALLPRDRPRTAAAPRFDESLASPAPVQNAPGLDVSTGDGAARRRRRRTRAARRLGAADRHGRRLRQARAAYRRQGLPEGEADRRRADAGDGAPGREEVGPARPGAGAGHGSVGRRALGHTARVRPGRLSPTRARRGRARP